ncbi:hypothetical protein ACFXTO_012377 [Malus domestica]
MIQPKNRLLFIAQVDVESASIESDDDSADVAVLHGAAVEAQRQETGRGGDVSESFGDSEAKDLPEANIKMPKQRKVVVVETSESEPASPPKLKRSISTRKNKRSKIIQASNSSASSILVSKAGIKKQKSSKPQASKKPTTAFRKDPLGAEMHQKAKDPQNITLRKLEVGVYALLPSQGSPPPPQKSPISPSALEATPASQFNPTTKVMLHFVDEDSSLPSPMHESQRPSVVTFGKPVASEIPVTLRVAILQVLPCPIATTDETHSSPHTQGIGEGSGIAFSSSTGGSDSSLFKTPGPIQQALREASGKSPPCLVHKTKFP